METLGAGLEHPSRADRGARSEFHNRIPAFLWGFAVFWYAMAMAFTWLVLDPGPSRDAAPSVIYGTLALFWFAGIVVVSMALAAPSVRVVVHPGRVRVTSRYPLRTVEESFRTAELQPAEVVDSVDSDGDPYFCVNVRARGDRVFTLEEGHHRPSCESTARRFNRAAGLGPRPGSAR